jgi:hypothetical protein
MSRLAHAGRMAARLRSGTDRIPVKGDFEKGFSGVFRKTRRHESSHAVYDGMSKNRRKASSPALNGRDATFAIFRPALRFVMKNV